jgi:hypothetical protein
MVNLTHPELAEITNVGLPPASLQALKELRNQMCAATSFTSQSHQKFLRRVLSPDSPTRGVLMHHGTGVGKTCTAIQIAEEYILRPEFQDKKVMVLASRAVQENFRTQIFDMTRATYDTKTHELSSKQCTGRRYLDMLLRLESDPHNWADPAIRSKLDTISGRIIKEFYEFSGYASFGTRIKEHIDDEIWIHENFDNRLLIIDEAHNIRESSLLKDKSITEGLEKLVKTANGLVLVLLTATPMFDKYDEIVYYMNLFAWNERKQAGNVAIKASDYFTADADFKDGKEAEFRAWCQTYVSYVKGENPFTFPFRLPPPVVASNTFLTKGFDGKAISATNRIKYLSLVESETKGIQRETLMKEKGTEGIEMKRESLLLPSVSVLPDNKDFNECFRMAGSQYEYLVKPFLTAEELPNHSAKFVSVIQSIEASSGIAFVYSNYKEKGARLFAMALEEHGYTPAQGDTILAKPNHPAGKGRYILLTSDASASDIDSMLAMVKSKNNRNGDRVRVVIASPLAAEGIDFRYMRQVHILDPWWNMSRIEQVIGRALRTCSHQLLPFEDQNCTVYLHVCRTGDKYETFDEYVYRTMVEVKAIKIAKIRKVMAESAMDCPIQNSINTLAEDWKNLVVPQKRAEGNGDVNETLYEMLAPAFNDAPDVAECNVTEGKVDPEYVRPLSTYLDLRDEVFEKLGKLLVDKPIWDREQLFAAMNAYKRDAVQFLLQQAITDGTRFNDSFGRPSLLESKGDLYALSPIGVPNSTLVERSNKPGMRGNVELPPPAAPSVEKIEVADDILDEKRKAYKFPSDAATRFSEEVLNGFVFDHVFSLDEKRAYLAKVPPPDLPFSDRIRISGPSDLIVLGAGVYEPPELPIGDTRTRLLAWTESLMTRFATENNAKLFASVAKNGKLTLSTMTFDAEGVPTRTINVKKFGPTVCGTGLTNTKSNIALLAKFIDKEGVGLPADVKSEWCVYTELLAREEHNIVWITPEEMEVLMETDTAKKVMAKLAGK